MDLANRATKLLGTTVTAVADHSWGDATTHIQRLRLPNGERLIAKHNTTPAMFAREHHALQHWAPALAPHAPRLIAADTEQRLLLMTALPGTPLCGEHLDSAAEQRAYHQAGRLMRRLHKAASPELLPDFGRQRAAYIRARLNGDTTPLDARRSGGARPGGSDHHSPDRNPGLRLALGLRSERVGDLTFTGPSWTEGVGGRHHGPEQGQHSAMAAYNNLVGVFDSEIAVLVGIGGSVHESVAIGDVVLATEMVYYERGKVTTSGTPRRGETRVAPAAVGHAVNVFPHRSRPSWPADDQGPRGDVALCGRTCGPIG